MERVQSKSDHGASDVCAIRLGCGPPMGLQAGSPGRTACRGSSDDPDQLRLRTVISEKRGQ